MIIALRSTFVDLSFPCSSCCSARYRANQWYQAILIRGRQRSCLIVFDCLTFVLLCPPKTCVLVRPRTYVASGDSNPLAPAPRSTSHPSSIACRFLLLGSPLISFRLLRRADSVSNPPQVCLARYTFRGAQHLRSQYSPMTGKMPCRLLSCVVYPAM